MVAGASAQSDGDPGRALALGHEGMALYNKGSWTEARGKFEQAEALTHSPVFVLYLARSARNAGDLFAAKAAYGKLVTEVVPAGSPAPWSAAVESAKQELPELEKRIAEAAASASASATAAPQPSATSAPTSAVVATAAPTTSASASPSASAPQGPSASASTSAEPARGSLVPGLAAVGIGAGGIAVGIGLFAHALSLASDIRGRCEGSLCLTADAAKKDTAFSFADGATAAFAMGGAALAAGVVLLIVRPGGSAKAGAGLYLRPGVASFHAGGSF